MSKSIEKQIDLSSLPTYYKGIDWRNSIGCKLPFVYKNISGEIEIIEYVDDHNLKIKVNNQVRQIEKESLRKCKLATVLDIRNVNYLYNIGDVIKVYSGDIKILDYDRLHRKTYNCECLICHSKFLKLEHLIKNGSGCPVCANKKVEAGINDMWTTAPELASLLYNKDDGYKYTKLSSQKLIWMCPICGEVIYDKMISNIYKQGLTCPVCGKSKSYPNRFMYALLKYLNADFKDEKVFYWSQNKKYDFYLYDFNVIIEMHGQQHYDKDMYDETYKDVQANDEFKKHLALSNSIIDKDYIVIDSRRSTMQWIRDSILNSNLSKIFDLSNVDWLKVEQIAQINLLKEACRIWDTGEHDVKKVAEQIGCHISTTSRFLRKGEQLGITSYTVKESNMLGAKRQSDACYQNSGIPFKCLETNQIFGSSTYAMKISKEVFGVSIPNKIFNYVANGKQSHTHNLHFQYITRQEFNTIKTQSPELAFGDFFNLPDSTIQQSA